MFDQHLQHLSVLLRQFVGERVDFSQSKVQIVGLCDTKKLNVKCLKHVTEYSTTACVQQNQRESLEQKAVKG